MKKCILLSFTIFLFVHYNVNGQTRAEIENLKKKYSGTWVNKKTKDYLEFYFEDEIDYVTVNEWTGSSHKNKSKTLDAYKAYIKGDKLIILAEKDDHHRQYCEISISNKKLNFECNGALNFTNNKLIQDEYYNRKIFIKLKE